MAERRRGLGRGLGALIPSAPTAESEPAKVAPKTSKPEASADGPADTATESAPQRTPTEITAPRATSPATEIAAPAASDAEPTTTQSEPGEAEATIWNLEPQQLDPQGASRGDSLSVEAPAASADDVAGTGEAHQVPRETLAPRRRAVGTDARQKAMRSRMDVGATLRNRAGVDRPSDMFFSPSSASDDSADEASAEIETAGKNSSAGAGGEVPRETQPASAATDSALPVPAAPTADAALRPENVAHDRTTERTAGGADDLAAVPGAVFVEVEVDDIHPNRKQPRQIFDEDELAELAYSIGELGVLQPIVVRPSRETAGPKHELVMGERRWRASQRAGLPTIPAIVRETADDELLRDALLENLHRSQLNPLEEAAAYQQLLEEFGATQEELSRRIGRSRPQISNTLRLMKLPPLVQRRVAAGVLSAGHARTLLGLEDPAEMERLAQRIVAEGLSVRTAEEAASLTKRSTTTRRAATQTQERHRERLDYIADAFADKLDTSVKINLGARKGRMTIEFASVEDLNRIITVLDPQADTTES